MQYMYARCIKTLNKANKRHRNRNIKQVTSENVACFYYWEMEVTEANKYVEKLVEKGFKINFSVEHIVA